MAKDKLSRADARKVRKAKKEAKRKRPATAVDVSGEKRPVPGPVGELDREARIVFGLQLLDHGGRWSWSGLAADEVKFIADHCKSWESMRAGEFMNVDGNTPIPFANLCDDAQERLREIDLGEHDGAFWHLRPAGKLRIWGVLRGNIFYLVWWDPNHEVCPSKGADN